MKDSKKLFGYINKFLDEKAAIEIITHFTFPGTNIPDLTIFNGLLFDPLGYEGTEEDRGSYLAKNVLSEEFGLDRKVRIRISRLFNPQKN